MNDNYLLLFMAALTLVLNVSGAALTIRRLILRRKQVGGPHFDYYPPSFVSNPLVSFMLSKDTNLLHPKFGWTVRFVTGVALIVFFATISAFVIHIWQVPVIDLVATLKDWPHSLGF
jgi:hypothetical protein